MFYRNVNWAAIVHAEYFEPDLKLKYGGKIFKIHRVAKCQYLAEYRWDTYLVIPQDDHITVVFFPGFQLATGKKGKFLYHLVRGGSQPALGPN